MTSEISKKNIKIKIVNVKKLETNKNVENNFKTFVDLFEFLQMFEGDLKKWLQTRWGGKDKQESLLRLFSFLGLVDKINNFDICKGNFNKHTIKKIKSNKSFFYDSKNKKRNLKDKGDSSDLTGIHENNEMHLLVTTSKNINKENVGKLDIDKILTNFEFYKENGYSMTLCVCIRNINKFIKMKSKIEKSNKVLLDLLNNKKTILIDWCDLNEAFYKFKNVYKNTQLSKILNSNKKPIVLKMHQLFGVNKTIKFKNKKVKKILWGHIQRSGKSYIIAGSIIEHSKTKKKSNYLIVTTAPNETIEQYLDVLNCSQLEDFNVVYLNGENLEPEIKNKNIIICSKQFLQTKFDFSKKLDKTKNIQNIKNNEIKWLKKMKFEMRFLDESHNGGTTKLAKDVLKYYGNSKNTMTIQITATYSKPSNDYDIPNKHWILWDLEDVKLCKNIKNNGNIERLVEKHGDDIQTFINQFSKENVIKEYSKYPDLWVLTDKINKKTVERIINDTKNNDYGWSVESAFLLRQTIKNGKKIIQTKFQNENENLKIWYRIFGKRNELNIPDDEYPDDIVFMKRIENICKNPEINSRHIGNDMNDVKDENEPMVVLAFLPQNNIDTISRTTIKLLEKHKVIPDYEIVAINSKNNSNPKEVIKNACKIAKTKNKKGVLVLSGRQCSLGVSINNCDIVLMLNSTKSFDLIYQMMFRCMTEGRNKKCGFVIDLNIHRVIEKTIAEYSDKIKPKLHPKESIQYILNEKLINLNGDHWDTTFGKNINELAIFSNKIYEIYSSNIRKVLVKLLERLQFKEILLSKNENEICKVMFKNSKKITEEQKEIIENILKNENEKEIQKGIRKEKINNENKNKNNSDDVKSEEDGSPMLNEEVKEEKNNYMDIFKHIIPLICIFTIHQEESTFFEMFKIIENDKYKYEIFLEQIQSWWGKKITNETLNMFIKIYMNHLSNDKNINEIVRTVKELFVKSVSNQNELSLLIDKYLIPQDIEKKKNAEVSTPHKLRNEMLDKMPIEFWNKPQKVFEPCSGKGGFLIDIINRFMIGLKDLYPDEKERYKFIVEECLYWCDINPTNIFICKLLIDPYNEYKINYHEGNTLELDVKEKWGLEGFDGVIGNPPYNSSGNTGTGNTIWQHFTKKALGTWVSSNGLLCYVHPPGWRKPNTKRGKFYGLYELMTKNNQMLYLSIHGIKDGQKTFSCGTRYDWYVIEKNVKYKNTVINDEKNKSYDIDMANANWIPNYNIKYLLSLIVSDNRNDEEKCPIIYNRSNYASDNKKNISKVETHVYKYHVIHTIPKSGIRYLYSNVKNKGHYGIKKVIFGDNGFNDVIIDMEGKYAMSENSMAIQVGDINEAKCIKDALLSEKFKEMITSCLYSSFRVDWRLFTSFKKDFWRNYIEMCPIIQSMSSYEPRKKWMSKVKTVLYQYECVHSTPKSGVRYMYSSTNKKGHFGVSKIIFGDSGIHAPIIDMNGTYGMTHHAMAIEIKNFEEGDAIKRALATDKFGEFIKSCSFSSFAIDWNIFKNLRRDFWREFI